MNEDLVGFIVLTLLACILACAIAVPMAWYYTTASDNEAKVNIIRATMPCPRPEATQ